MQDRLTSKNLGQNFQAHKP